MSTRKTVFLSLAAIVLLMALLPLGAAAGDAGPKPIMRVGNIRMVSFTIGSFYRVFAAVPVRDGAGMPVPDVGVTVEWTLPNGVTFTRQAGTNANGVARFIVQTPQTGTYQICVLDLAKTGFFYAWWTNFETCDSLIVP